MNTHFACVILIQQVVHSGGRKALNQSGLFNFGGILV
jgi:hypothetical protein